MFTIFASFLPKVVACCAAKLAVGVATGASRLDYVTNGLAMLNRPSHEREDVLERTIVIK